MQSAIKSTSLNLKDYIIDIPDFPKPGIIFKDISPLLRSHFNETIAQLEGLFAPSEWKKIDCVVGIESRGFILAAGLAAIKQKGFVKIRKKGKLPGEIVSCNYTLEYGEDALEMQYGTGNVLIVDDVLATGGTLTASGNLAKMCGYKIAGFLCLINLANLNQFSYKGLSAKSLLNYEA